MSIDLKNLTISKAQEHLVSGDFSARELAEAYLRVIEEKNQKVNAYLEIFDDVLAQASTADKKIGSKDGVNVLTGIPLAIKDNILISGRRSTAASKILANHTAVYDATATKKLKSAGAIFLGRTNMDEFAMGSSTEYSAFGGTRNPHDLEYAPGGSSGGSAAAVAMDGALGAFGSDTGGSVRQPASFCGIVGLKPTYGAVSRYGLIAMGSSLDQIGPLAKTVGDAEILFNAVRGQDIFDSTSLPDALYKRDFITVSARAPKSNRLTIGVPWHCMKEGIDKDVLESFSAALRHFESLGYIVREINLPHISYSLATYYIIMPAEVSTNLARYDGVRYGLHVDGDSLMDDYRKTRGRGFGKEARRRILLGAYVLSAGYYDAYYSKAVEVRHLIVSDFRAAFDGGVDLIATPTSSTPAFRLGEKTSDPLQMYLEDIFTVPANIAGIPAISAPMGFAERDGAKLPLGLQLMAAHTREDLLFMAGKDFLGENQ